MFDDTGKQYYSCCKNCLSKVIFVAKKDTWFDFNSVATPACEGAWGWVSKSNPFESGDCVFEGFDEGEVDEELCNFSEFNIFFENQIINNKTFEEVHNLLKSDKCECKNTHGEKLSCF